MKYGTIFHIPNLSTTSCETHTGFPIRTRTDICESMLGLYPISCEVIIRKMLFLHKLLSLPCDFVSHQMFLRKLYLYLTNSPVIKIGFVPDICRLLCLFELQHISNDYTSVQHLPSKCQWKKQVKSAVLSRSMLLLRQRLYNDNDFVRFRDLHTSVAPAIVWKMSHSGCDLKFCDFIARLWASTPDSGTYICSHCNCQYRCSDSSYVECG